MNARGATTASHAATQARGGNGGVQRLVYQLAFWLASAFFVLAIIAGFVNFVATHGRLPWVALNQHLSRGDAFIERGAAADALREYSLAARIDPGDFNASFRAGVAAAIAGDNTAAAVALRHAARIDPRCADCRYQLGLVLARAGDLPAAIVEVQAAVALAPSLASAWGDLGRMQARLGQREAALASLERAIEIDPGAPGVRGQLELLHDAGVADGR